MNRLKYYFLVTLLILSVSSGYGQTLKDYLLAYWSFDDGTANDMSGHGYNGIIMNNPTLVTGVDGLGYAYRFQGRGSQIQDNGNINQIGDHILLPQIPFASYPNFTITMWVYEESFSYIHGEAYLWFGIQQDGWLGISHAGANPDTTLYVGYSVGSTDLVNNPIRSLFDYNSRFTWVFYSLVYSNGVMQAYRNGEFLGSKSQSVSFNGNKAALSRHWWWAGSTLMTSSRFTGAMDEVMIFTKGLTQEEVDTLYNHPFLKLRTLSIYSDKNNICQGDTIVLTANGGFTTFLWNTGETTQSIVVNQSGTYSVVAKDEHNNEYTTEYNVTVIPNNLDITYIDDLSRIIDFGDVNTYEQKSEVFRVTNIGNNPYPLSGISLVFNNKFNIPQNQLQRTLYTGDYQDITVTFNSEQAGIYTDTVYIPTSCNVYKILLRAQCINTENMFQITMCDGDDVILDAGPGYAYYSWSTGAYTESIIVTQAGEYDVTTRDILNNEYHTGYNVNFIPPNLEITYVDDIQKIINFDTVHVGEQKTQSIKIKNIGSTPYPLSKLSLVFHKEFYIPDYILNLTLNPGDSKYITVIFKPDIPGMFTDTVLIPTDCKNDKILLSGNSEENLLSIKASTNSICNGDTLVLNATPGFASYLWNTGETTQRIIVDKEGLYSVTTMDAYGQQYHAEYVVNVIENSFEISYSGIDSSTVDVGDIKIGDSGTGSINIKNTGSDPINLSNLLIHNKIYFNISQSQLDTTLLPGESIDIIITFSPDSTGLFRDTLLIRDNCKDYIIALKGHGYDKILMKLDIVASRNSICIGDTVVLNATPGFTSYLWNTGETTQSIIVDNEGMYSVTTTDQYGQEYKANYQVNLIKNSFEISYSGSDSSTVDVGDIKIGESGTGTINIKNTGTVPISLSSFLIYYRKYFNISQSQMDSTLMPGDAIDIIINFTPDSTGFFNDTLLIRDNCTDYIISLKGKGYDKNLMKLDIFASRNSICLGDTVVLNATPGFSSYLWNTGETNQSIIVNSAGMYSVTATDPYGQEYHANYLVNIVENSLVISYSGSDSSTVDIGDVKTGETGTGTINIKNIGSDTVSLSSLLIYYRINFNISQSQLDTTLMPGESIDVVITFIPDSSGSFIDTLFIKDNCKDNIIKLMGKGYVLPKMNLDITATSNSICQGDTVVLNASAGFSAYLWNTGETTQSIIVNNSGLYSVTTTDQYGQKYHAEFQISIMPILFEVSYAGIDSNLLDFGDVFYGVLTSRTVTIRNISNQTASLKNIFLYYNMSISVPQSQLNQILNPGDEIELEICFEPHKTGVFTDTLKIEDNCLDHIIPIAGNCLGNTFDGESKCKTAIAMGINKDSKPIIFHFSDPYPNPAEDMITVSYYLDSDISIINLDADFYNIDGYKVYSINKELLNTGRNSVGEFQLSIQSLSNGFYYLNFKNDYNVVGHFCIIVNK